MRRKAKALALTLTLLLVAVACGDDDASPSPPGDESRDDVLDDLEAAAIIRLVTVDNSFGPDTDPFDIINVGTLIGGDANQALQPSARSQIATALEASAEILFIDDVEAVIDELFDQDTTGTAVASVEDRRIDGERAELDMRLWCGSLCGVFLTYEAELTDAGWEILGTTGPIAVS